MLKVHKLTVAEQEACWQEYCQMLARNATASLRELQDEEKWAAHWEHVFSMLEKAERSADADAAVFGAK